MARGFIPYKSYMFRGKDPAIDQTGNLIAQRHGKISTKVLRKIEGDSRVTTSTMHSWFFGKTKRPQNATLEAVGRALGYHRPWVKIKAVKLAAKRARKK